LFSWFSFSTPHERAKQHRPDYQAERKRDEAVPVHGRESSSLNHAMQPGLSPAWSPIPLAQIDIAARASAQVASWSLKTFQTSFEIADSFSFVGASWVVIFLIYDLRPDGTTMRWT